MIDPTKYSIVILIILIIGTVIFFDAIVTGVVLASFSNFLLNGIVFSPECGPDEDPNVTGCYDKDNSHLIQVTVMIFRTGSVIIVGKCNELVNITVYKFIRDLFETEMSSIYHSTLDIAKIKKIKQDKVIKLSISTVQ